LRWSRRPDLLAPHTRLAILISLLLVTIVGALFASRQNRNPKLGGAISKPKQLWLAYAIYVWFFLAPILAFEPALDPSLRLILTAFGALMWLRGIAEMVMMYGTKTWRPPYGIAHDLLCITVLVALAPTIHISNSFDLWTAAFVGSLVVSLGFETYYARAFFHAVEGKTTGEEGLWFASENDPRFARINRVTRIGNTILCAFLTAYLLAALLQ
jgi:hypothetical protein